MQPETDQATTDSGADNTHEGLADVQLLPCVASIGIIVAFSLILALSITTRIDLALPYSLENSLDGLLYQFSHALSDSSFLPTVLLAWAGVFVVMLLFWRAKRHWYLCLVPLALFFGFTMVFGFSLDTTGSINMLFEGYAQTARTCVAMAGWCVLFYIAASAVFSFLEEKMDAGAFRVKGSASRPGKRGPLHAVLHFVFDWHPFVITLLLLLAAWMPAIVGYAPALFLGDTPVQLAMWYGIENCVSNYVELVDPDVTMTTHHPVLHTLVLGACVQYGLDALGSAMEGIYLYIRIQLALTLACFAYGFTIMKKLRVAYGLRLACLLMFAFVPWYNEYAMLVSKDVPFAGALLVFCLELVYLARKKGNAFDWVLLLLSALMVTLMRNGGELFAYAGLAVLTVLLYARRFDGGRYIVSFACVVVVAIVATLFSYYTIAVMHVSPGNKLEALSVPVQQTARYVGEHPDDITDDEREAIDKVLVYEGLASRYNPLESDSVKNYAATHLHDATDEDWANYYEAWMAMGTRHPDTYAVATMNAYYGYFYVSRLDLYHYDFKKSVVHANSIMRDTGLFVHMEYDPANRAMTEFCEAYLDAFEQVPLLNMLMRPALWCWALLLLTAFAIRRKWRAGYPAIATLWFFMLVFLIGPCNGATYTRYAYPLAVVLPYVISVFLADAGKVKGRSRKEPQADSVQQESVS